MNILIVDDQLVNRVVINKMLCKEGYPNSDLAESAHEAFDYLGILSQTSRPKKNYNLILMDISMPEMDGIEACHKIKSDNRVNDIPIIMVTAQEEVKYLKEAFEAGAVDYIQKPLNSTILISRIASVLKLQQEIQQRKNRENEIIDIGVAIQKTLLTGEEPSNIKWLDISTLNIPSQKVDGDFFDFFHFPTSLDIMVGDVMGKGVPAALISAATKSQFFRMITKLLAESDKNFSPSIESIVNLVHKKVSKELENLERFVTLVYARFDKTNKNVDFIDCGHTRTIHYLANQKKCELLEGINLPLGFNCDEIYTKLSVSFDYNDIFVFYSDGITEAVNDQGQMFGENRLIDFITTFSHLTSEDLSKKLINNIHQFTANSVFNDDLTCVIAKIN